MLRLVQWGAGNIGRSFIGRIFAANGACVTFVDIDRDLVTALNAAGSYRVVNVSERGAETVEIGGITAVNADDEDAVRNAVLETDFLSISVGKNHLPGVASRIAGLLVFRSMKRPHAPLDIIIAENIRNGAAFLRTLLIRSLPEEFPFDAYVGLVETSLGKMVPIRTSQDILTVYAEPFNTLIVDRDGFRGVFPDFPQIKAVSPISAWVDEKLYIHNLGHACAAYLGNRAKPEARYIHEILSIPDVKRSVKNAMIQGALVLKAEHPGVFSDEELYAYIDDLLSRFADKALADTVFRVGRDLERKLAADDRLLGAILLAEKHSLPWIDIGRAYLAAFSFNPPRENNELFPADDAFLAQLRGKNLEEKILSTAGGTTGPEETELMKSVLSGLLGIERNNQTDTPHLF